MVWKTEIIANKFHSTTVQWVWNESADLAAMHFRFLEKRDPSGYVVGLASNLQAS